MPASSASPPSDLRAWTIAADQDQGFGSRAREVWQYRRILWFFSIKALQALYSKTHLGVAWIFIRTLVPLGVSSFVFGSIMAVPSGKVPYLVFMLTGMIPWNCFDGPVIRGSRGLEVNRELLTKLYVPRIILPMGQMAAGVVEPVIIALALVGSLAYYRSTDGVWYFERSWRLMAGLGSVALALIFGFSISLWTSIWQARARDARFAVRYALVFWMYFTPVLYPLSMVPSNIRWLVYLNPLTAPTETFKWAVLPGMEHSWAWFGYSAAITVLTFLSGVWYFTRSENATMDKL